MSLTFIDLEASSLVEGYPIEFGWATVKDLTVSVGSFLIRPTDEWYFDDFRWSVDSEAIHKIKKRNLLDLGVDVKTAREMIGVHVGKTVFSDSKKDAEWLSVLYELEDLPFVVSDIGTLYVGADTDERKYEREVRKRKKFRTVHRAGPDALDHALFWYHTRTNIDFSDFALPKLTDGLETLVG